MLIILLIILIYLIRFACACNESQAGRILVRNWALIGVNNNSRGIFLNKNEFFFFRNYKYISDIL